MTIEPDVAAADTKIRTPRHAWVGALMPAALQFAVATFFWVTPAKFWPGSWFAWVWVMLGCFSVAKALWLRTRGVDLTHESAILRGFRRRTVPWHEVQAVVRKHLFAGWVVQLIPESGKPVTLRAPASYWGLGAAKFEQDHQRIGQWWVAHRGASWCPKSPQK
jgi:hypothetical protein